MIKIELPSDADIEAMAANYPAEKRERILHAARNQNLLLAHIGAMPSIANLNEALDLLIGAYGSLGSRTNATVAQHCADVSMQCAMQLAKVAGIHRKNEGGTTEPGLPGRNVMPASPHTH